MAISSSSYFLNSAASPMTVAGEYVDIYADNSSPKYAVGTMVERQDGAFFRYAHFGSAVSAGTLVASTYGEQGAAWAATQTSVAPSSSYQMPDETVGVYPGSIGSRYFITYITGTANQYAGAYLSIIAGTGAGYTYRIRGNTATSTPVSNAIRIQLYDQIVVATDATSQAIITGLKYSDLATATTLAPNVAGVTMVGHAASKWGWIQVRGYAGVLCSGAVATIGQLAMLSTASAAGAVQAWAIGTTSTSTNCGAYPVVGYFANVGSATAYATVSLNLE